MSRDGREPLVVYNSKAGFVNNGFTVVPTTSSYIRIGQGLYVMVPVLSENDGAEVIKRLASQPVGDA